MAKKTQTETSVKKVIDPIEHAECMVYGTGLQVEFNQKAYDKDLKSVSDGINRLAKNVDEIIASEYYPHEKVVRIERAIAGAFANLNIGQMFMRGHDLEESLRNLKHETEILELLKSTVVTGDQ